MKKKCIMLIAIIMIAILTILVGGGLVISKQVAKKQVRENEAKTRTYENGDFVYLPTSEEIVYDSGQGMLFHKNILDVFLDLEISDEEVKELVKIVDGTIVGRIQGPINILQIQVKGTSFNELIRLAERFEDAQEVKFVDLSSPTFISDASVGENQTDSHNDTAEDNHKRGSW